MVGEFAPKGKELERNFKGMPRGETHKGEKKGAKTQTLGKGMENSRANPKRITLPFQGPPKKKGRNKIGKSL